jgi:hypothetical protein
VGRGEGYRLEQLKNVRLHPALAYSLCPFNSVSSHQI